MNRAFLLALTLGVAALAGCAVQTANGDPSSTSTEPGANGATPAASEDSAPLAEGTDPSGTGQARVTILNGGATPPGAAPVDAVRTACGAGSCGSGVLDNSQPLPWWSKTGPAAPPAQN